MGEPSATAGRWNEWLGVTTVREIARLTGGRAAIYENVGKALDRINEITRVEYLLGYYPKDETWNGDYRRIDVKVNRRNLRVSFRHGYYARDAVQPSERDERFINSRVTAAGAYERDLDELEFKVDTAALKDAGGQPQIKVDLQIEAADVAYKVFGNLHTARLRIAIYYADAQRHYLGADLKTMDLNLLEETYQQFLQTGIHCSIMIPEKAPRQILKVIIYDIGGDKLGSKLVKLR